MLELPVEGEDPVEVQSQTAAVVDDHSQLLPLWGEKKSAGGSTEERWGSDG